MHNEKPLSDLYKLYKTGKISRNDLEGGIFQHLLDNLDKYRLFSGNRDEWNDFVSWLYPRIKKAVENYRDLGSSMDAYVATLVNGAYKEYRCREVNHSLTEHACWQAKAEELVVRESEPEYLEAGRSFSIPADLKPRQVLFLLLKSYFFAPDCLIEQVAKATGYKAAEIRKLIEELHKRRSGQEEEILKQRDRLQSQYYRCLAYQKQKKCACPGTEFYEAIEGRTERALKRLCGMKKRFEAMRKGPSNRMIAEIMGIPKGTVDSGLHNIKNQLIPPAQAD